MPRSQEHQGAGRTTNFSKVTPSQVAELKVKASRPGSLGRASSGLRQQEPLPSPEGRMLRSQERAGLTQIPPLPGDTGGGRQRRHIAQNRSQSQILPDNPDS